MFSDDQLARLIEFLKQKEQDPKNIRLSIQVPPDIAIEVAKTIEKCYQDRSKL